MSERSAFLAAIIANPDDDTVRLVYADWLQEQGEEERAEFIRVQVELWRDHRALVEGNYQADAEPHEDEQRVLNEFGRRFLYLRRRERELLKAMPRIKVRADGCTALRVGPEDYNVMACEFRRGFIASLTCPAVTFLQHADALIWYPKQNRPCPETAMPVRAVTLTTMPGYRDFPFAHGRYRFLNRYDPPAFDPRATLEYLFPGIKFTLPDTVPVHEDNQWHEEPLPPPEAIIAAGIQSGIIDPFIQAHFPGQTPPRIDFDPPS